jgi:chemotaxis protein methyltransferase CheR
MSNNISEETLSKLSRFVTDQLGLSFPRERFADLKRGLISAAREFDFTDAEACLTWLLSSSLSRRQIEVLASPLTIGETYFFRDSNLFNVMEEEIIPGLVSKRRVARHLRIWSAGCASGEEVYSIAILLHKLIPDLKDWNITILATDINPGFLKKAENGVYGEWSFREAPMWIRENYFINDKDSRNRIVPLIKKMVNFSYLNLAEDSYPSLTGNNNAMDVIFCRNVLMYFEAGRARSVIRKLYNALVDGGWLIVSPCEVLHDFLSPFVTVHFPGAVLYRKDLARPRAAEYPAWQEIALVPEPQFTCDTAFPGESPLNTGFTFPALQPEPDSPLQPSPEVAILSAQENHPYDQSLLYDQALDFYNQGLYPAAAALLIELCSSNRDVNAITLLSRALANQGNLAEAKEWCEKAVVLDKLNPGLHYLLGIIFYELGRLDAAMASLKRSLYLDQDFILAHFTLANINRSAERFKESNKNHKNALALLDAMAPDRVLPESEGITAGRLKEIINSTYGENGNG